MALLELVETDPDWANALGVAVARPPGVAERRTAGDPWKSSTPEPSTPERPRRISDDLAWFRDAIDEPQRHGLRPVDDAATVAWEPQPDPMLMDRLKRLRDRGVLEAAGFLLHEPGQLAPQRS